MACSISEAGQLRTCCLSASHQHRMLPVLVPHSACVTGSLPSWHMHLQPIMCDIIAKLQHWVCCIYSPGLFHLCSDTTLKWLLQVLVHIGAEIFQSETLPKEIRRNAEQLWWGKEQYHLLILRHLAEILATSFCTRENCAGKYLCTTIAILTDKKNTKHKNALGFWFFKLFCSCLISAVCKNPTGLSSNVWQC